MQQQVKIAAQKKIYTLPNQDKKNLPRTAAQEPQQDFYQKQKNIRRFNLKDEQRGKTKRWSIYEDKLYIKFLEENAHLFRYKSVRRVRQIFTLLSQKMGGLRTPAQCKSHHQKMRNATAKGTIKQIIAYIKQKNIIRSHYNIKSELIESTDFYQTTCSQGINGFQININVAVSFLPTW